MPDCDYGLHHITKRSKQWPIRVWERKLGSVHYIRLRKLLDSFDNVVDGHLADDWTLKHGNL